jgi:hypothetical protein
MDTLDVGALSVLIALPLWWLSRRRVVRWLGRTLIAGIRISSTVLQLTWWIVRVTVMFPHTSYRRTRALLKRRSEITFVMFLLSVVVVVIAPEPWIMAGRFIVIGGLWTVWFVWKRNQKKNKGKIRPIGHRKPRKEHQHGTRVRTDHSSRNGMAGAAAEFTAHRRLDL